MGDRLFGSVTNKEIHNSLLEKLSGNSDGHSG